MDRPLEVIDRQNVTLKSTGIENVQPLLVPKFFYESLGQCLEIECPFMRSKIIHDRDSDYTDIFVERSNISVCSAIHLINVTLANINGIKIAANLPYYVSGLIIDQSMDIYINNTALALSSSRMHTSEFGLLVYNSSRIVMDSLKANNFSWGIASYKSISISISNTKIQNCGRSGVSIFNLRVIMYL